MRFMKMNGWEPSIRVFPSDGHYLTITPVARRGCGSIAHVTKPHGLLTRSFFYPQAFDNIVTPAVSFACLYISFACSFRSFLKLAPKL